ncbi:Gfo/Idh/MocA family protein [Cohnella silvisoli]|uniref:Gfo/Idh/MocA family oxidoreductase n=1 Tax=Cohnella silvisoli TaxID=2873699 RepID=A0ABV1L3S7_9BACL|nr:Gfo/Idh/MocA family oxidoreductase [Cohnella silvisoli]MCD9026170.1 Gfo/Idh/MocA family oxidoreductase [Cohnella silvisoli]
MKVNIVGAGNIAEYHARSIKALGHELGLVADFNEKSAQALADKYGCRWTTSTDSLLSEQADLVTVAVPNAYHYDVAAAAVKAGHAVLCEKPMTRSSENSRQLVELVKQTGRPFFVGYMKRLHPTVQKFADYSSRIGQMRSGLVRVYHPMPDASWPMIANHLALSPGSPMDGVFVNSGSHMLDLLLQFAGPVKKVLAARMQYHDGCYPKVDKMAHALLEMENGATVTVECGWLSLFGVGRRENGWDELIELRGDEGLATLHTTWWERPQFESPVAELWDESLKAKESFNAGMVDNFQEEYRLIEKALSGESVPLATVEEAFAVDQLIDDIFAAAGIHSQKEGVVTQ